MQYYIYKNTKPEGPYSLEALSKLSIERNTLVWHEGLKEPQEAQTIETLQVLTSKIPPRLQKHTGPTEQTEVQPPALKTENDNQHLTIASKPQVQDSKAPKQKRPVVFYLTILLVVAVSTLVISSALGEHGFSYYNPSSAATESHARTKPAFENAVHDAIEDRAERKRKAKYRDNLVSYLHPHPNKYKKNLIWGGIWNAEIKMDNPTPYSIDQAIVRVGYYKADGSLYKTEQVVFTDLGAGERQAVHAPDSDRGIEMRCWIEGAYSSALH